MSTVAEILGGPLVQAGTGALQSLLTWGQRENRPAVFQPWTQSQGGVHPGYGGESYYLRADGTRGAPVPGVRMPDAMAEAFGAGPGATVPRVEDMTQNDLMALGLGDISRGYQAAVTERDRRLGAVGDYASELERTRGELGQAGEDWTRSVNFGEQQFAGAGMTLRDALARSEQDTAAALNRIDAGISEFRGLVDQMIADVGGMTAEVLQNARNHTATLLASVTPGIAQATQQQIADTVAGMRAQGAPEAQIQAVAGQMAAEGQRQIGDMLGQIGAAENARLSNLERDLTGFEIQARIAGAQGMAGILETGMAEAGAAYRNLSQVRAAVANTNATLATEAANWRAGRANARADLVALSSKIMLGGRMDLFNMVDAIEEPFIMLGPLMQGLFEQNIGLQQLEYENNLTDFSIETGLTFHAFDRWQGTIDRLTAMNEAEAQRDAQASTARGQMWSNVAGSTIGAVGDVWGGYYAGGGGGRGPTMPRI